jgi:hypothetical protein
MMSFIPLLVIYIFLLATLAFPFQTPLHSRIVQSRQLSSFQDVNVLYSTDDDGEKTNMESEAELEIVAEEPPPASLSSPVEDGSIQFDYFSV